MTDAGLRLGIIAAGTAGTTTTPGIGTLLGTIEAITAGIRPGTTATTVPGITATIVPIGTEEAMCGITPRGLSGERPTPQADASVRLRLIAPLIPVAARSAVARPAILLRVAVERRSAVAVVAAADLEADVLPVADVALAGVGSVAYEYRKMLFNV